MLRNAHAPEDHRSFGGGEFTGDSAQGFCIYSTHWGHIFWTEIFQVIFEDLPVLGVLGDVICVVEIFFDDHMHDRV